MTKGTRSLGRVSAIAAPMLAALVAASCSSGGTSDSSGSPAGTGSTSNGGSNAGGAAATSTGTNAGTGTGGDGGAGGVADPKCVTDADCVNDAKGKVCDVATGSCVACTVTSDVCPQGEYCDPASNSCKTGCTDNADCASGGSSDVYCDTTTNTCAGCIVDTDCPLGSVCFQANKVCIEGCSDTQACKTGFTCCSGACLEVDLRHGHQHQPLRRLQHDLQGPRARGGDVQQRHVRYGRVRSGLCQLRQQLDERVRAEHPARRDVHLRAGEHPVVLPGRPGHGGCRPLQGRHADVQRQRHLLVGVRGRSGAAEGRGLQQPDRRRL
ncbi:MAG: hypothetical protein ACMG6S_01500 [Byssovorax sp.]